MRAPRGSNFALRLYTDINSQDLLRILPLARQAQLKLLCVFSHPIFKTTPRHDYYYPHFHMKPCQAREVTTAH